MAQYRKKPVVIEAWKYEPDATMPDWLFEIMAKGGAEIVADGIKIKTLEGTMRANPDDWIIKGVKGEIYPCKPDIFEATYEPVE